MSQPKSNLQSFTEDWGKVRGWASSNKISSTAVDNVYQLDLSRLQSGYYPMSNAERTRAVMAAAGLSAPTQLPQDDPSAWNIWGNVESNVQKIAVGLMPNRLFENIWGTVKNTAEDLAHPGRQNLEQMLTSTALSWLPGASDIGTVMQAGSLGKGLEQLAKQPVSAALDVMPAFKALDLGVGRAIASSAVGDALASRVGMETGGLARLGAVKIAGKGLMKLPIPGVHTITQLDEAGNPILTPQTLGERLDQTLGAMGTGATAQRLVRVWAGVKNRMREDDHAVRQAAVNAASKLDKNQLATYNALLHSGRSLEDLLNDQSIEGPIRVAIEPLRDWVDWERKVAIETGQVVSIKVPVYNRETQTVAWVDADYEAASPVIPEKTAADSALELADRASAKADEATQSALSKDRAAAPLLDRVASIRRAIQGTGASQLQLPASYVKIFGQMAGRGGILDQLATAARDQDWETLRDVTARADRMLTRASETLDGFDQIGMLTELQRTVAMLKQYASERARLANDIRRAWNTPQARAAGMSAKKANDVAIDAMRTFLKKVRRNPPSAYRDIFLNSYYRNLLEAEHGQELLDAQAQYLKENFDVKPEDVDEMRRSDPKRIFDLITAVIDTSTRDPFLPNLTAGEDVALEESALDEVQTIMARGERITWLPTIGRGANIPYLTGDDVYINPIKTRPTMGSASAKLFKAGTTVNDVMLGVSRATKEQIARSGTIEFWHDALAGELRSRTGLRRALVSQHFARELTAETSADQARILDDVISDQYGYRVVDPTALTGLKPEELGLNPAETYYLPKSLLSAAEKMINKYQMPLDGIWDKGTNLFKLSILAPSLRYSFGHVGLGGMFLTGLRLSNPAHLVTFLPDAARLAWRATHGGDLGDILPREIFSGASQEGSIDMTWHYKGAAQMKKWQVQEDLDRNGPGWRNAKPLDVARSIGRVNMNMAQFFANTQKAISYLDGSWAARRRGYFFDQITGKKLDMTPEQMRWEGIQAAERALGNLDHMTPLSRAIARKIIPFWGWTQHVLKYVVSYPFDHPWRVVFLSQLASQNSDRIASGLDDRIQLLFYLGSPGLDGNVNAIDIRQLDPFRDVANYMSLAGWLQALNPAFVAPFAVVDPNIIFGSNVLYPNVDYDTVYGTSTAAPSGNWITAVEQEIPETTALDDLIGISSQARQLRSEGGTKLTQDIASSLGFPWIPESINLRQIAAEHEIDRYHQAADDAATAWQTGDFSTLLTYPGTVPDPLNTDYDITPRQLQAQYEAAKKRNPALPPSETVADLPSPAV